MKLVINFCILIFLVSCQIQDIKKVKNIINEKNELINILDKDSKNNTLNNSSNDNILKYIVGKPYFIEGVKYTPEENYNYKKVGFASFYGKELHNKKTINNDYNKVTELLARHKTLPIPSIVKVTNLENGLSLTLKINDRHEDNFSIIQVSRKSAQLLKFFKNKIAKVRVEIVSDPSKQMKIVTKSMSELDFNGTIASAPTELVSISDISAEKDIIKNLKQESPIEIGFTEITKEKMFLKIYEFKSYGEAKKVFEELRLTHKFSTQNNQDTYTLIIGPIDNIEANNLVLSFIAKGYKKTEFYLE